MDLLLSRVHVGIFSCDDESSYRWLATRLSTKRYVSHVHSVYVSNSSAAKFREDVRRCSLAILYHTRRRGRINITDVTDSLYNEELEYLSSEKGKENIIVVIDDLEGNGDEHKTRILQNQPSIGRLAMKVFCFTEEEKKTLTTGCPAPEVMEKLRQIQKMIEEQAWRNTWHRIYNWFKTITILVSGFWMLRILISWIRDTSEKQISPSIRKD